MTCGHSIYMLKGRLRTPDGVLKAGMFFYAAVTERHGPLVAEEESESLFYTDGPFDYHLDDVKQTRSPTQVKPDRTWNH